MVGLERDHPPGHLVERRAAALAVDDVHAMPRGPRDGREHERADAGDVLLAFSHPVHAPVPADVGRLDEDDRPGAHRAPV